MYFIFACVDHVDRWLEMCLIVRNPPDPLWRVFLIFCFAWWCGYLLGHGDHSWRRTRFIPLSVRAQLTGLILIWVVLFIHQYCSLMPLIYPPTHTHLKFLLWPCIPLFYSLCYSKDTILLTRCLHFLSHFYIYNSTSLPETLNTAIQQESDCVTSTFKLFRVSCWSSVDVWSGWH